MSTMCSLSKKYLESDKKKYIKLLNSPQFMCTKCGRVANDSKNLCSPVSLKGVLKPSSNYKTKKLKKTIKTLKKKLKES